MTLTRDFYERPTLEVAKSLIGKVIHFQNRQLVITETEAYIGIGDPACHAAKGLTPRTAVMFGPAGFTYVYFIYGMYHCLNIVTEKEGTAAAVLIRGAKDMSANIYLNGPGKLCKYLNITKEHNNRDIIGSKEFHVVDKNLKPKIICTPRIGIKQGRELLWRFVAVQEI